MCEVCGSTPCKPLGGKLVDEPTLEAEDWARVYDFMRYVYLPFIHTVIADARIRQGFTVKGNLRHKKGEKDDQR